MIDKNYTKLPRLYIDTSLTAQASIEMPEAQSHYLKNVMRRKEEDQLRIFNERDGEWLATIKVIGKKSIIVQNTEQIRAPENNPRKIHLIFSPLKKDRMDFLIEKATELGVTTFHPALTHYTQHSKIKTDRIEKQIIGAAEQCERLDIPSIKDIHPLTDIIQNWNTDIPVFAALERAENIPVLSFYDGRECALLIGPEGGFDEEELTFLKSQSCVTPVSLGQNILRAETAVCTGLSLLGIA